MPSIFFIDYPFFELVEKLHSPIILIILISICTTCRLRDLFVPRAGDVISLYHVRLPFLNLVSDSNYLRLYTVQSVLVVYSLVIFLRYMQEFLEQVPVVAQSHLLEYLNSIKPKSWKNTKISSNFQKIGWWSNEGLKCRRMAHQGLRLEFYRNGLYF